MELNRQRTRRRMAGVIYLIIGILALTACIHISINAGDSDKIDQAKEEEIDIDSEIDTEVGGRRTNSGTDE